MDDMIVPVEGIEGDDDNAHILVQLDKPGGFDQPLTEQDTCDLVSKARIVLDHNEVGGPIIRDRTEEYDMRPNQYRGSLEDASGGQDALTETLGQGADGGGQRLNAGKNRIELLPETWIWALADVMTQGSKKYEPRNWEKGMDWSTMVGCIHRHLAKFQGGQRYDGEEFDKELGTTGCHELAMVAWNALALMHYDLAGTGNNDLVPQQLDLFRRVNAATSDLERRHGPSS